MAYIDQTMGGKRKATVMIVVAALQGAAIVALVNGFTVDFIKPPPPQNPIGENIEMPLPPPPKVPENLPKDPETPIDRPDRMIDLPASSDVIYDPPPVGPIAPFEVISDPRPEPPVALTPKFTPQRAQPSNTPANWASSNDYPSRDLREGNQGVTGFKLIVGTNGRVLNCMITQSSGFAGLDKATCEKVSQRAKFKPAMDGNGQPTTGEYASKIHWEIPE